MPVEFLGIAATNDGSEISARLLTDAIDIGQQVIPIVRAEVAKRDQAALDQAALDQAGAGAGRPAV